MNPLAALGWLLDNWRTALFFALVAALGAQSYRLQGSQAEANLLRVEKQERQRRDATTAAANLRNKERTDEEEDAARKRAAVARVVPNAAGVKAAPLAPVGGDGALACFGRGELDAELAGWSGRAAVGLADVLERSAARSTGVAREGEALAAAARALRSWALNLEAAARPAHAWVATASYWPRPAQAWRPGASSPPELATATLDARAAAQR